MTLTKKVVNLLPAKTVDTEADPKQSRGPRTLLNCYVDRAGEIARRPGYSAYTRTAQDFGSISGTRTIRSLETLFDFAGAPAMIGTVENAAVSATDDLVAHRLLRYADASAGWYASGTAFPMTYAAQVLQPGDALNGVVATAAVINNVLCVVDSRTRVVGFFDVDTGRIIARGTAPSGANSRMHVAAVGSTFIVFARTAGTSTNGQWQIQRYNTSGTLTSTVSDQADFVATSAALRTWSVNGTTLNLVYKNTNTGNIEQLNVTASAVSGPVVMRAAATATMLGFWALSANAARGHLVTYDTTPALLRSRHDNTGAQVGGTIDITPAGTTVVGPIVGGGINTTATDGWSVLAVGLNTTATVDTVSITHNSTRMWTIYDTTEEVLASDVQHVHPYGKPIVFDSSASFSPVETDRILFPCRSQEHTTTNDYYLIGMELAKTGITPTKVAHVYTHMLPGRAGYGASGQSELPDPQPIVPLTATTFGVLVNRTDRTKSVDLLDPAAAATIESLVMLTVDLAPLPRNVVSYNDNQAVIIDGAKVTKATREGTEALGFLVLPEKPVVTGAANGANEFSVKALFESVDAVGDRYQSAVSEAATTSSKAGQANITSFANIVHSTYGIERGERSTALTEKGDPVVGIFSTTLASPTSTLHQRIGTLSNNPAALYGTQTSGFTFPGETVTETLLQDGTPPIVETIAPPGLTGLIAHGKRLFGISMDDPTVIWYTAEKVSGAGWRFSDLFTIHIAEGGPCLALGFVDDTRVVFKAASIYTFSGGGPDTTGTSGSFTTPSRLSIDVGLRDVNSVVSTAEGVFFKSAAGIYVLNRGQGLSYIGQPVASYNDNICIRAFHVPTNKEVRFLHEDGIMLVWDYEHKVWSVFTVLPNSEEPVDGATIAGVPHLGFENGLVAQETADTTFVDTDSTGGSNKYTMQYKSEWIAVNSLQGFQRVWWIHALGEMPPSQQAKMRIYYDYDEATVGETVTLPAATPPVSLTLTNLGFESQSSQWTVTATGATASVLNDGEARTGSYAFKSTGTVGQFSTATSDAFPVRAGTTVTASAYYKRIGAANMTATTFVTWLDASGATISEQTAGTSTISASSYSAVGGALTAPANTVAAKVSVRCSHLGFGVSVDGYVDDVSIALSGARTIWEHRVKPAKQKCKAIQVELICESGDSNYATDWRISQVSLICGVKGGRLAKLPKPAGS